MLDVGFKSISYYLMLSLMISKTLYIEIAASEIITLSFGLNLLSVPLANPKALAIAT